MLEKFRDLFFKADVTEVNLDDAMGEDVVDEKETDESVPYRAVTSEEADQIVQMYAQKEPAKFSGDPMSDSAKKRVDIIADGPYVGKEAAPRERARPVRRDEFEIPQVISPFYGTKEDPKGDPMTSVNAATPHVKRTESFNEVISPFYGVHEERDSIGASSTQDLYEDETQNIDILTQVDIPSSLSQSRFETLDEDNNLSLDEIIVDTNVDDDDLIQFSLFGENKKIQEESFDNENMETQNDSLPF